jgi:hypothetical protein
MLRPYDPYVPKDISEIMDLLGSMMLDSPTFVDKTGYFPGQSIDTEFFALAGGLKAERSKLGDKRYAALVELSARMRAHFEADPEDKTDVEGDGVDMVLLLPVGMTGQSKCKMLVYDVSGPNLSVVARSNREKIKLTFI